MFCSIMKCKKTVSIRIFIFGCTLLCGCQPNPTDSVVANKNDGAMESAINRTIEDSSSEYAQSRPLEQGEKVESFAGADPAVQVDVNFKYTSINKEAPVIRVIPHAISSEEAQKYTQVLFQGQPAYEDNLNLSKSEIETKILELKQFASDEEDLADRFNNNQEDIEEAKDFYQKNIDFYKDLYENVFFCWQSPMDIVSVENAAVETKTFEEVYNIFKKQTQAEYTVGKLERSSGHYGEGELEAAKVQITEAEMGLARIRVKDHLDEYRLVPVWVFRGSVDYESSVGSFKVDTSRVLITVNAIDGSIIDPVKGY